MINEFTPDKIAITGAGEIKPVNEVKNKYTKFKAKSPEGEVSKSAGKRRRIPSPNSESDEPPSATRRRISRSHSISGLEQKQIEIAVTNNIRSTLSHTDIAGPSNAATTPVVKHEYSLKQDFFPEVNQVIPASS